MDYFKGTAQVPIVIAVLNFNYKRFGVTVYNYVANFLEPLANRNGSRRVERTLE